ncbi:MAG TPA: hypothetical protein DCE78_08420 [Bacteroidetes bacterium]|nr:hypothetical protein [Bacteroidota bacterium]
MKRAITDLMIKKFKDSEIILPPYNPDADFNWIKTQFKIPWLRLSLQVPYQTVLKEINLIQHLLTSHRDDYAEHYGWSSFCIHGKAYNATREDSYYNDDRPHTWTKEAVELMPDTVKYFQTSWPGSKFKRLRVMCLDPGGYILIHSDPGSPGFSAVNIAITQPAGCNFVFEKYGTVPYSPGQAFWLNINGNHAVENLSTQRRWHLIVHQDLNHPEFQNLVVKSYHDLYNKMI